MGLTMLGEPGRPPVTLVNTMFQRKLAEVGNPWLPGCEGGPDSTSRSGVEKIRLAQDEVRVPRSLHSRREGQRL